MKKYIVLALKGMGMGAADVVPGVSGGTIAFITGIYQELIESIRSISSKSLKVLVSSGFGEFWKSINGNFLLAVVTGIAISVFSLARILRFILENHPEMIWSFFFGLIIASAIYIAMSIKTWKTSTVIPMIVGVVVSYMITALTPAETTEAWWFVFLSGSIAICAMILPGISGSFILLLLGKYSFIINAVSEFKIGVIAIFMSGAVVGIIAFSNVLSWLLNKFHHQTIALLAGFMIGSLNKVWPWKNTVETFVDRHGELRPLIEKNVLPAAYDGEPFLAMSLLFAVIGFVLIFAVERIATGKRRV